MFLRKPPSIGRASAERQFPMADGARPLLCDRHQPDYPYAQSPRPHRSFQHPLYRNSRKILVRRRLRLTPMGFPYEEDTEHFHACKRSPGPEEIYRNFLKTRRSTSTSPTAAKRTRRWRDLFRSLQTTLEDLWETGRRHLSGHDPSALSPDETTLPFTPAEKEKQLELRAHYVEFNLLYDRGTKFGFLSGETPTRSSAPCRH